MNDLFQILKKTTRPVRRFVKEQYNEVMRLYFPRIVADNLNYKLYGHHVNWKAPVDINEKMQWLLFNTDVSIWSMLADKFAVRMFVAERGCEEILVPLYGRWDKFEDINWQSLPDSFVLKTNHGYGNTRLIYDKKQVDVDALSEFYGKSLKRIYGLDTAEIHYRKIKPCIIAEGLLDSNSHTHAHTHTHTHAHTHTHTHTHTHVRA